MIVRRKRNDSGEISEWLVIPEGAISDGVIHRYWKIDLSYGLSIIPDTCTDASVLECYEMEESFETLIRCIKETYSTEVMNMMYEYMNENDMKEMC